MKQLKIGTMAEVCSTTPRALRHYQDEGILQPEIVDEGYGIAGPFVMENIFRYMRFFNSDAHSYYRHCLPVRRP